MGYHQVYQHTRIMGAPEGIKGEKMAERRFEDLIMVNNLPNLMRMLIYTYKKLKKTPNKINSKRYTLRLIKLSKVQDEEDLKKRKVTHDMQGVLNNINR